MQHVLLKDVTPESHMWTVRVRLTRFSEYVNNDNPPMVARIDFILLDAEGNKMEGQIPQNWVNQFRPQIKEDHVYYIRFFQVRAAWITYRPVDHPYMVRFTSYTQLQHIDPVPETFPFYAHSAVSFDVLRSRLKVIEFSSDTIGVFMGCTPARTQNTKTGAKRLRNVYISDGRETATVALWGNHADQFDADRYMELGQQRPLVFLFVAVTSRIFEGKLQLQGTTLCRWYANPVIPETAALQDSCTGRLPPPSWHGPTPAQAESTRITITDLASFTNPHVIYNNRYVVVTKIKNIVPNQSWWYMACTECNRSAMPNGDSYRCNNQQCNSTIAAPRYRLSVMVTDPTPPADDIEQPSIEVVFFGPAAEEVIGVPVDALIAVQAGIGEFLPDKITNLHGRQYELRVSVSPGSLQRSTIAFQVDNVLGAVHAEVAPPSPPNTTMMPPPPSSDVQGQCSVEHVVGAEHPQNQSKDNSMSDIEATRASVHASAHTEGSLKSAVSKEDKTQAASPHGDNDEPRDAGGVQIELTTPTTHNAPPGAA